MKHIIAYNGVKTSLALLQEEYGSIYLPWPNLRTGIEGTRQRPPYSQAMWTEWVQGLDKKKGIDEVFAVLTHAPGRKKYRYIGHMGLRSISLPSGIATSGSILGDVTAQGKGHGTEAKLLLLYHAFMVLGLRKVTSVVTGFNARSLGHLIKCGYQIVGRDKKHIFHEGAFIDQIRIEVFREDWEPIWNRYQKTRTLPSLTTKQRALVKKETST